VIVCREGKSLFQPLMILVSQPRSWNLKCQSLLFAFANHDETTTNRIGLNGKYHFWSKKRLLWGFTPQTLCLGPVHVGSPSYSLKSLEVNRCNLTRWEHKSWDLPLHTRSRDLSPQSLEVNPCNLSRREHGSWDLPLHTGSQVLSLKHDMDVYMKNKNKNKNK